MTKDAKAEFMAVYSSNIRRDGAAALLYYLENRTDFFTAPASTRYHLAYPGGLVEHSLNVYKRLLELTMRQVFGGPGGGELTAQTMETVAILGLLHDVCKAGVYHTGIMRELNPETGKWEDCQGYFFQDQLPLGHGEKSLYIISKYMKLTDKEALAIRWHMGLYDASASGARSMDAAMAITRWVKLLQDADMSAAQAEERGAAT